MSEHPELSSNKSLGTSRDQVLQDLARFHERKDTQLLPLLKNLASAKLDVAEAELENMNSKIKALECKISKDSAELAKILQLKESLVQASSNQSGFHEAISAPLLEPEPVAPAIGEKLRDAHSLEQLMVSLKKATYTGGGELKSLMDEFLHLRQQVESLASSSVSGGANSSKQPATSAKKAAQRVTPQLDAKSVPNSRTAELLAVGMGELLRQLPSKSDCVSLNQWDSAIAMAFQKQRELDLAELELLNAQLWMEPPVHCRETVGYIKTLSGEMTVVQCEKKLLLEAMDKKLQEFRAEHEQLTRRIRETDSQSVARGARETHIVDRERFQEYSEELPLESLVAPRKSQTSSQVNRESLRSETMELEGEHFEMQQIKIRAEHQVAAGLASTSVKNAKKPASQLGSLKALLTGSKVSGSSASNKPFAGEMSEWHAAKRPEFSGSRMEKSFSSNRHDHDSLNRLLDLRDQTYTDSLPRSNPLRPPPSHKKKPN